MVALSKLILDEDVNIRFSLDEETVLRYVETFDILPPVLVVSGKEGQFLVDGFHRTEAAYRLGKEEILAEVKRGTREDAIVMAAGANADHGLPLTYDERTEAIWRLSKLGRRQVDIAKTFGLHPSYVADVIRAKKTEASIKDDRLNRSQYEALAVLEPAEQKVVAQAAAEQGWTVAETREVVRDLRTGELKAGDVRKKAAPHLTAMRERLQWVRIYDNAVEAVRRLESSGITPVRLLGMVDDSETLERWRGSRNLVSGYVEQVNDQMDKQPQLRAVK